MKRLVIAALGLIAVTPAFAQGGDAAQGRGRPAQTKAEAEARAQMLFGRLDLNHDAFVTQDEVDQFAKTIADRAGDNRMSDRIRAMFANSDANHDGKISPEEAKAGADQSFDLADTNHDGTITPDERRVARGPGGAR